MDLSAEDYDAATRTLDGEARGEAESGQYRVAFVIRNRAFWSQLEDGHPEKEWWGNGVYAACKHPWQFSCWNGGADTDHINALESSSAEYIMLLNIIEDVFQETASDDWGKDSEGNLLTHYKVRGTCASWDSHVEMLKLIPISDGKHDFYALGPTG